ncbi:malonyl-CoA decarboxylase domain-containing protein [Candidatus Pelagibacter sp. HIMB109]|uniref:malonyl-CoA decarboxylase domain-containing protein n=1 Tax=Candidatus Pelagibacter sp. HIMB109 TaxID=3415412 RepID=UPI003F85D8F5
MLDFKKLFSSIADAGQNLIGKKTVKKDLPTALQLCDDLISFKGIASGIAIAREITEIYSVFNTDQKLNFFKEINKKFSPNKEKVKIKIAEYLKEKNEKALNELGTAVEGNRQELIRRLNMAPNGTPFLVSMREDLIKFLPINPELKTLDEDIRHLFKSWFNPGFLRLEKITWESKAAILEKIIKYEKVHQIKDMNDLKRRLQQEDRRFFAYFHPVLKDEPLIFVEVAFTKGIGNSIQEIVKPKTDNNSNYDTATFYSISNCQEGLMRVTLGNFLIKRVVFEIQEENPKIKNFGTLSPLPGFSDWFLSLNDEKLKDILKDYDITKLNFLRSSDLKIGEPKIIEEKTAIKKLVANYLINEKINNKPLNPVSRFHLGNGASIYNIIINGNISDYGYKESFGIMVNYGYQLEKLEKIHEDFITKGIISYSDKIKKYV